MRNKILKLGAEKEKGGILISAIIILIPIIAISLALLSFTLTTNLKTHRAYQNIIAMELAEAGVEKALWEFNQGASYMGETDNSDLSGGIFDVEVNNIDSNNKEVIATAYIPNKDNFKVKRRVRVKLTDSPSTSEASFHYAVQIGDLGLTMYANSEVNGNTYSNNNITGYSNSRINGDAYAVGTISSPQPTISGTKNPGAPPQEFPFVDIDYWKQQANINNDPIEGDHAINSGSEILGPRKINGNLLLNSNSSLTLKGPLHVTGNFEMNSNTHLYIDEGFGSTDVLVIVDGTIKMNSNSTVHTTSADPKGFIFLVSTNTSTSAIELNSNTLGGVYYTSEGKIQLNSNAHVVSVTGRGLVLNSNAILDYDAGLASTEFSSGPGGVWAIREWQVLY